MSRRDPVIQGPMRATDADIDDINRVFSDAFTERYHRDGMTGVRVPLLNPPVWRYALTAAGDGALVWRDDGRNVAAFNLVHSSGREGWMGPLAVRPDCQGRGLGRAIVTAGIQLLKDRGCRVIGLETMPRTIENIGFYSGLGFRPGHLTITLARDLNRASADPSESGPRSAGPKELWLADCAALVGRLTPIPEFSREMSLTIDQRLGDVTQIRRQGALVAFALWHTVPLAVGRTSEEIRVLKLAALDSAALAELVDRVVREAMARGLRKVTLRCQTAYRAAYRLFLELGFRVHWTDLRMTLDGYEEPMIADGVVFSNWEI
jgi:ribosomal protein S18 acetylase RimI-like enzyme